MPSYRVTLLDRANTSFEVQAGQSILDAADAAGVILMSGCRTGACRSCAARMVKGRVHMSDGIALTPQMLEANVVLTCAATVSADTELLVGRPGTTLLHPRHILPWSD